MGMVSIYRGKEELGQFEPEEVLEGLKNGKFLKTDQGWWEPLAQDDWRPLSEYSGSSVIRPEQDATKIQPNNGSKQISQVFPLTRTILKEPLKSFLTTIPQIKK